MSEKDTIRHETPTRRECMKYGGAVVGGGLFAGCTGQSDSGSSDAKTLTETGSDGDGSYEVCLPEPGCVEFDASPSSFMTYRAAGTDMVMALGQADGFRSVWQKDQFPWEMYDEFPGVSTPNVDSIESVSYNEDYSVDKEWFYELDCDLHVIGPQYLTGWALSAEDIEELQTNVAPFFFQYGRGPEFANEKGFEFLGLYPIFERVAKVLQAHDRYEQFEQLNDEFVENIRSQLPKKKNKPSVGVISIGDEATMNAYKADNPGWGKRQYRTLQIKNAFADQIPENERFIETDFETLVEADPDIIFELSGFWNADSREEFEETVVKQLQNDPVASKVTAVQEGRVHASGNNSQGPLLSMLQTEVLAKQMHPEVFGSPRSVYDIGTVPDEPLFDRQRVADIINGDI